MLKNKTKLLALLTALILLFSTTVVFADEEDIVETTSEDEEITTELLDEEDYDEEDYDENEEYYDEEDLTYAQEDNTKEEDVYLFEDTVVIDYTIDGNLFVMANDVTIDSQISGDAFILAKNITITENGYIYSNLFAAANTIKLEGIVYSVYATAQDFSLNNGYIYTDAKIAASSVNISGTIGRNAFIGCSKLEFTNVETNTAIYGDLTYSANEEANIPENAVSGNVTFDKTSISTASAGEVILDYVLNLIQYVILVVIIWLACLWLAPKFLEGTNSLVGKPTLKVLGFGLLALIVIPIIALILVLLRLTSSVALVLTGIYLVGLFLSKSIFTIAANNYLCSKLKIDTKPKTCGMLVVTCIIVSVLMNLPFVGWLFSLAAFVLGLGILVVNIIPKRNKLKVSETK